MNPKEQRDAELKAAQAIAEAAKGRPFTDDERTKVDAHLTKADELDVHLKAAEADESRLSRLAKLSPAQAEKGHRADDGDVTPARTIGEHFAKEVGESGLHMLKSRRGYVAETTEWTGPAKAATDPNLIGSSFAPVLTDVDRTIARAFRRETVADVLGTGSIAGTSVTYYVEAGVEGSFTTVAEGAQKPQLHFINPSPVTDTVKKIAGWWDTSDEMIEDLPFMESEINNRGLYLLSLAEEAQLLNGDGVGTNVLGLLNRSGIQTEAQAIAPDNAQDTIFRALTKVETATGLTADAIIINPADYQSLRLSRDANGQYYGGGFFSGEYGNGGVAVKPPLWGVRTIVTPAVAAKTVVVGAFQSAATVYRKGGVRVESTNSDLGKFTKDIRTTRIEERLALAARMPLAVVKVTLL